MTVLHLRPRQVFDKSIRGGEAVSPFPFLFPPGSEFHMPALPSLLLLSKSLFRYHSVTSSFFFFWLSFPFFSFHLPNVSAPFLLFLSKSPFKYHSVTSSFFSLLSFPFLSFSLSNVRAPFPSLAV